MKCDKDNELSVIYLKDVPNAIHYQSCKESTCYQQQ